MMLPCGMKSPTPPGTTLLGFGRPTKGRAGDRETMPCTHFKADGTSCRATALPGKDVCAFHDPSLTARRAEGRRRGGVHRSRPAAVLPHNTPDAPLASVRD